MRTFLSRGLAALLLAVLAGCAVSPDSPEGRSRHDALWQDAQRQRQALVAQQPASRPRLLVLAVGLSDETKAFPGDVNGVVASVRSLRSDALVWQMWNPPFGEAVTAPFATRDALRAAVAEMRAAARPGDRILVMLTSHGHHNLLAHVAANRRLPPLRGEELHDLLLPLAGWETGVIISACHSGSLVPALRHPQRWIMTAAAADRVSYGCQFLGSQTYFIQALLHAQAGPEMGLDAWHAQAAQIVRRGEDLAKFTPSLPQLWVGSELAAYRQSLKTFWQP